MLIPPLCLRLKVSVSNKFLMINLSEGLDPVVFLSVTHVHMHTHKCTCVHKTYWIFHKTKSQLLFSLEVGK